MVNCTYRYLVLYDNENNLIYGECIKWLNGEFDFGGLFNSKPINLGQGLKLKFCSSADILHSIEEKESLLKFDDLSLKYTINVSDFIAQRYDQPFNPLIDRCSKIDFFARSDLISRQDKLWLIGKKSALKKLKEKTQLDLLRNLDLLNTFSFYEPTRIIVRAGFLDKRYERGALEPKKLQISFYDEFHKFDQATYEVKAFREKEILERKIGSICETILMDLQESPDELEIKIFDYKKDIVYDQRYYYIKSIGINATLEHGSVQLGNGRVIQKYSTDNFTVGEQ
ncbi:MULTISPECIES: hypothetical protein [Acinetobacter calcoaceticus/baumannii complex]|uniref:hypothetical protein n=1 Tax=Acinetobacter calcoaceticus/baumannii complex TaxID=909768 RepID=UPI001ADC0D8A|nr:MULTISPECIES: hypothetical protein [Acinetobacter calcoaceticus/baumannii complex]MBO8215381.1 hypothetical protein [Acinetobacter nosocomialis]MDV7367653.1 hypothetical protein [Acinetobacter baumannii]MDV7643809.1 hypothetical protein [Acinetobacter baumannii]